MMPQQTNIAGHALFEGVGVGVGASGPGGFVEPNYEVFDPLNWLLDGLVEMPSLGMELQQGIT